MQQERTLQLFKRIAMGFLLVTSGSSLLLFILTLSPALPSLKQQENNVMTNLSFTQGKVAKYLLVKNRLTLITGILKNRYPLESVVATLLQQIPDDVSLNALSVSNKTLSMNLSSDSVLSLNTALNNITALMNNNKIIKKMVLQGISANQGSTSYVLTIKGDLL